MQTIHLTTRSAGAPDNPTSLKPISMTAARVSFYASGAAILLLAALHLLSPEFDPTWRMVSEYALGNYAWVLSLMFVSQGVGCLALFFAIKSQMPTLSGKIGLVFLFATAVGLALAAVFDFTHPLHGLTALIGIPSLPISALLISLSLRHNPAWSAAKRILLWTAVLTWVSLVLMLAALFIGMGQTGGQFTPAVLVGVPNRLLVVSYSAWIMVTAWQASGLAVK